MAHEDKRRFEEDFGQGPRIRDPGEEVASEPMPVAASHPDGLGDGLGERQNSFMRVSGSHPAARGAAGPGKPRIGRCEDTKRSSAGSRAADESCCVRSRRRATSTNPIA